MLQTTICSVLWCLNFVLATTYDDMTVKLLRLDMRSKTDMCWLSLTHEMTITDK